jgi:hypothetical protein
MLEYGIAFAGGVFVFLLLLWILRGGGGPSTVAIPKPKNPIGFAPEA